MASRNYEALLIITAAAVVGAMLPATASADNYVVGDGAGWDLNVDYEEWASFYTFHINDTLEFSYSGSHNVVVEDDEGSYKACAVPSNAMTPTTGDDTLQLGAAGQYFFICGVADHCVSGMKLAVSVR